MATAEAKKPGLRTFDPEVFDVLHDIPVFDEHEVEEDVFDASGKKVGTRKVRYSQEVLQSMCDVMNGRIEDTGDYVPLVIGHTPTQDEKLSGLEQPDLVGFAGPYYVETWGDKDPRPAIYAKNWATFKDDAALVLKNPRRSPEVWCTKDPKQRYFDPIALLGAETPRRDLGLAYSKATQNIPVQRYAAPCFPAASNTFVPGAESERRKYQSPEKPQEGNMALEDQDVQKLVAAVMELAPMKWAQAQMEKEQAKVPDPAAPPEGGAPPEAPAPYAEAEKPKDDLPTDEEPKPKDRNAESEMSEPQKKEQYRREALERTRYAQMEAKNKSLETQLEQLTKSVGTIQAEARQKTRYAQVEALANEFVLDASEEFKRADVKSEADWEDHMAIIRTRYQRTLVGAPSLYVERSVERSPDEKARYAKVVAKANHYANLGVRKTSDEIEAEVDADMKTKVA